MSHDLLNKFNIIGALTKPGTECMPKVVHTEMWEEIRLTVFQLSLIHFLHVVGNADSLNRPVDVMGTKEGAGAVAKNETVKSVQCQFIIWVESLHSFDLKAKLFSYFRIEDRNGSGTALGFGSSDVKTGFSVNDPVDKIVVDENRIFFKVDVAFRDAGAFCHAHPRSQQYSHNRKPMTVSWRFCSKAKEVLLLGFRKCDSALGLRSTSICFELAVNSLAGIFPNIIVVHCQFKCGVNDGVDALQ